MTPYVLAGKLLPCEKISRLLERLIKAFFA
jgi:hypothetical protein